MIMKRKDYQKPTMRVVKLQRKSHLLVGSGLAASRNAYTHDRTDGDSSSDPEVWQ